MMVNTTVHRWSVWVPVNMVLSVFRFTTIPFTGRITVAIQCHWHRILTGKVRISKKYLYLTTSSTDRQKQTAWAQKRVSLTPTTWYTAVTEVLRQYTRLWQTMHMQFMQIRSLQMWQITQQEAGQMARQRWEPQKDSALQRHHRL